MIHIKVLITIPFNSRVPILSRWLKYLLKWVYASNHQVEVWIEDTPNRMDWSISACVQYAKDSNPDVWVRLDADTVPETPLDECLQYVFENKRERGWDVTGVATIMMDGVVQARFEPPYDEPKKGTPVPNSALEVVWVSGSLVFTPKSVFSKMEPVGEYVYRDGKTKNFYIQPQHPSATEDVDFCERIRALGFKVCADLRIHVGQHRPQTNIPSLRSVINGHTMRFGESVTVTDLADSEVHSE